MKVSTKFLKLIGYDHSLPSYSVIAADTLRDLVTLISDPLTLVSGHTWRKKEREYTLYLNRINNIFRCKMSERYPMLKAQVYFSASL